MLSRIKDYEIQTLIEKQLEEREKLQVYVQTNRETRHKATLADF